MRKEHGLYLIELYDELSNKTSTSTATSLTDAQLIGDEWCKTNNDYSAVIMRVINNSKIRN